MKFEGERRVRQITLSFDWHSYADALLDKYEMMCFYALRTVFPELEDAKIKELYSKALEIGYENPREAWYYWESAVPYAVFL